MKKYFYIFLFALAIAGSAHQAYARTYTTSFPATEQPISQSGVWINGSSTGLDWSDVWTQPGMAYGTEDGTSTFNDSTAILNGTWDPNQSASATIKLIKAATGTTDFEEVELRLRTTITAHSITGYEVNFSCNSNVANDYTQIDRWNGPSGNFTNIDAGTYHCVNGDVVQATMYGSVITVYINGLQVMQYYDTTYKSGSPGIGFYMQGGPPSQNTNFGFSSFTAQDLTGFAQAQAGVEDQETSGNTTACTFAFPPGVGDMVVMGLVWYNGTNASSTITSIKEGTSTMTLTPKSPEAAEGAAGGGAIYLGYLLNAPAGASTTLKATFGTAGSFMNAFCDDFAVGNGSSTFDEDAVGSGASGVTISTPTIPMTGSTDLLYFTAGSSNGISSVNGTWLIGGGAISPGGNAAGYILNSTVPVAVAATQTSGPFDTLGGSFKFTQSVAPASAPSNTSGYAWGNYLGWVNFGTQAGGLEVLTTTVTGYAWSQNFGWINMAPASSGVINDGNGNLSGDAWGQDAGYIDFSGVTIDSSGVFHGTAVGSVAGSLVFDTSTGCTYCNVSTTWTPAGGGTTPLSVSGVNVNGTNPATITLTPNTTTNVTVNATVTDNSCSQITGGTTTILFYRSGITSSTCFTTANNSDCYIATAFSASSTCSGGTQNTTTTIPIQYFAQATDASSSFPAQNWIATVIFRDSTAATSFADSTHSNSSNDISTLIALNVTTSSISYGLLIPSSTTGSVNQTTTIANAGNASTTLQLSASQALTSGVHSIATSSQGYATSTFTYPGSSVPLSATAAAVSGFLLTSPTSSVNVQGTIFWGLQVPNGTASGTYNGTNLFTSVFSP